MNLILLACKLNMRSNRTFMELKSNSAWAGRAALAGSNRTFMELKLRVIFASRLGTRF